MDFTMILPLKHSSFPLRKPLNNQRLPPENWPPAVHVL